MALQKEILLEWDKSLQLLGDTHLPGLGSQGVSWLVSFGFRPFITVNP